MIQGFLPIAVAETGDQDAVAGEQQGKRAIGAAVAWIGHIGARAAVVEVAAEGADDVAQ